MALHARYALEVGGDWLEDVEPVEMIQRTRLRKRPIIDAEVLLTALLKAPE